MGGSTPVAPVQSNAGELMMARELARQNDLLYQQSERTAAEQAQADEAAAENMREIAIRDAKAEAERVDREHRAAKGKKDLLYKNALGVDEEEEDLSNGSFLKLGGA